MRCAAAIACLVLLSAVLYAVPAADADPSDTDQILVDYGNGSYEWYPVVGGFTVAATVQASLGDMVAFDSGALVSVGGRSECTLLNGETCKWNVFLWDGQDWTWIGDLSEVYAGGCIAVGYYSVPSMVPCVTPLSKTAWTSFRGDSSLSAVGSEAPRFVATPIEWYNQVNTGGVYSSVLYAGGYIYHTTGGGMYSVGSDQSSYTYCIDVDSQTVVWSFKNCNYLGYEVTTPLIIGDFIIISSANEHMFCLDRYTGEPVAELLPSGSESILKDCPLTYYDLTRTTIGKCGPTSAVYDTGALYFGTADGLVKCYTVDDVNGFRPVWNYKADGEQTFYYLSPTVAYDVTGSRVILSSDEGGNIYCLDAGSGTLRWKENFDGSRINSVSVCSDSRLLVATSTHTYLVSVDDGHVLKAKDMVISAPSVIGNTFYAYVDSGSTITSHYGKGTTHVLKGVYAVDIASFEYLWINATEAYTKSGLTYADGYLYAMDYAPSSAAPNGGCLRCYDPNSGTLEYSVMLDVNSQYSMCTPSVADGRIFVGNDSGTVYILSEVSSRVPDVPDPITNDGPGLRHWSWIAVISAAAVGLAVTIFIYRRTL